jgi:hypothetical protein
VFAPAAIGPVTAPTVGVEEHRPLNTRCSSSARWLLCAQIRDGYQSKQQTLDGDRVPPTYHSPKTSFSVRHPLCQHQACTQGLSVLRLFAPYPDTTSERREYVT